MGITPLHIAMMLAGAAIYAVWLILYIRGRQFENLFEPLTENDFPLKEIYSVGYAAIDLLHMQFHAKADRQLRKNLELLYGEKYAEYYLYVTRSQQITTALTILCFAVPMYLFTNEIIMFILCVVGAGTCYYYYGTTAAEKIKKRSEEMLSDFSEAVSKLALLVNAGMILKEAWVSVAETGGDTELYREMRTVVVEMNNGYAEADALYRFGHRCTVPEIKKFTSTVMQGLTKGNNELAIMLTQQSKEIWNLKQQNVRRAGEKASSKLMLPICMIFVGILIMVIVPIFTNLV